MRAPEVDTQPATAVITHTVHPGQEALYEAWLGEIGPICKQAPGHLNTTVILPVRGVTKSYTVIIRFDKRRNLLNWMESAARKALIRKVRPLLVEDDRYVVRSGLDFWFSPEGPGDKMPTRWKQSLVTWSAIYPLVMLVPLLMKPLLDIIPLAEYPPVRTLLVTGTIVLLMVYVVMPRYTRLVHKWLYR